MFQYSPMETIKLGPLSIQTWGFFVVFGFLAGVLLSYFKAKGKKINPDDVISLGFWSLLGGIIGARALFVFYDLRFFLENPLEVFKIWHGGMAIYGGILLALLFDFLYIKKKKLNFWQIADLVVPGLALGLAVGRVGCFLLHEHIGYVMKTPRFFGINYFSEIRHEISLYLILSNLFLFLALSIFSRYIKKEGVLFLIFLLWYSLARLLIDHLRDFEVRFYGLMISQWIAAVVVLAVSFIYFFYLKNKKSSKIF